MKKLLVAGCAALALVVLGSCTYKTEKQHENTASGYDYVADNMKISDGVWSNNWVTAFNDVNKRFEPTLDTRAYKGLDIYLGRLHSREIRFDVARPDGPVYIEAYMLYTDSTGAQVAKLLDEVERGRLFTATRVGWNLKLDFDGMPPTTSGLKIKVQKGRETLYLDAKFQG